MWTNILSQFCCFLEKIRFFFVFAVTSKSRGKAKAEARNISCGSLLLFRGTLECANKLWYTAFVLPSTKVKLLFTALELRCYAYVYVIEALLTHTFNTSIKCT